MTLKSLKDALDDLSIGTTPLPEGTGEEMPFDIQNITPDEIALTHDRAKKIYDALGDHEKILAEYESKVRATSEFRTHLVLESLIQHIKVMLVGSDMDLKEIFQMLEPMEQKAVEYYMLAQKAVGPRPVMDYVKALKE